MDLKPGDLCQLYDGDLYVFDANLKGVFLRRGEVILVIVAVGFNLMTCLTSHGACTVNARLLQQRALKTVNT